uniref:RAB, member RAS onco family like 6 n=1 Tax=Rhinopithecus bieti TaxID=61621 RepID=A0A2K6LH55_RHIBE
MFSALKKLVGSEQAPGRDKNIPAGLQSMNQALQRRFAKGVQYNMKIVIRGDRNTGKTALWHRLQGRPFVEEYIPTQEIQVTSIHWSYKTTDDIVKVEVWDVVDKGKCKKRGDGLKMENDPQEAESDMALDAEFLDVYKSCNGVVMMFDITKQWTFNYILRELPKVPTHVPVCVLGNYRDMGEHRVILPDDVRDFIDNLDRPPGSSYFRYAESSMKNSFGLKYLHKFFNIPFLQLQKDVRLTQGGGCAVLLVSEEVRMPAGWDCCWGRFGGKEGSSQTCAVLALLGRPVLPAEPSPRHWVGYSLEGSPLLSCSIP